MTMNLTVPNAASVVAPLQRLDAPALAQPICASIFPDGVSSSLRPASTDIALKYLFPLDAETWSTPAVSANATTGPLLITADRSGTIYAFHAREQSCAWRTKLGGMITASPTLADIDGDGVEEAIIGTHDGSLFALRLADGQPLRQAQCGSCIRASAAVAEVDGEQRIFVPGYGTWMFCLDARSGRQLWRRYLPKHEFLRRDGHGIVSSPLVADVDQDGELEVVNGIRARRLYCLSARDGRIKWFRPLAYDPDSTASFCFLQDKPVVIFGGGEHTSGLGDNALFALRGEDGSLLWKAPIHGAIDSSPVIDDVNEDGRLEIVVTSLADASCYCLDLETGARLWQHSFGPTAGCIHDEHNVCRPAATGVYFTGHAVCRSYTTPLVADLDGDRRKEVVVGSCNGTMAVLDGTTGAERWSESTGSLVRGSPVLADIDNDGLHELCVASGSSVRCYGVPARATDVPAWRMFKGTPDHRGCRVTQSVPVTISTPVRPRWVAVRLVWHWLIADFARFLLFHVARRFLHPLGLRLFKYYY